MQDSELPATAPADISSTNFDLASYIADFIARLTVSVPKPMAQAILHIGKTKLEGLVGEGKLDAVKNGPRTEITVESIKRLQASMPRATFKAPPPPRMEHLDKLHAKQRRLAAQWRAKRALRHRSKARGE
jgi:hypothetical protein